MISFGNQGKKSAGGGGSGTVTVVSVVTANGFSGSVANDTTTPAITLTLQSGAVSLAQMADVATSTVFYRKTAGTGVPEVQTLATLKTDLGLTGTNSGRANPTGTIGLTAVNGTADTFISSDGTPALSQAIAPTWTAVHAWVQAIANVSTDGLVVANNTAATSGSTLHRFPRLRFRSHAWSTGAGGSDATHDHYFDHVLASASTSTARLSVFYSLNGAAGSEVIGFSSSGLYVAAWPSGTQGIIQVVDTSSASNLVIVQARNTSANVSAAALAFSLGNNSGADRFKAGILSSGASVLGGAGTANFWTTAAVNICFSVNSVFICSVTSTGFSLVDGKNLETGTATGSIVFATASQRGSFYGATPIAQPASANQAAVAAQTQDTLTDSTGGTANTTLVDVGAVPTQANINDNFADIAAQLAKIKTDIANIKTYQNQTRTDLVNLGLQKGSA